MLVECGDEDRGRDSNEKEDELQDGFNLGGGIHSGCGKLRWLYTHVPYYTPYMIIVNTPITL